MTNVITLSRDFYNRVVKTVQWVERVSRNFSITTLNQPTPANQPNLQRGNRIWLGQIAEEKPDGTPFIAGVLTGGPVYPVRLLTQPQSGASGTQFPTTGQRPTQSDDPNSKIVWATNLSEWNGGTAYPNQPCKLLPGQKVLLFEFIADGQSRYVFTASTSPNIFGGAVANLTGAVNSAEKWLAWITTGQPDQAYTYTDTSGTVNVTLSQNHPNSEHPQVDHLTRLDLNSVTDCKAKSRRITHASDGSLWQIEPETGVDIGTTITVTTDVRLTKSGDQITLEKKTQQVRVLATGAESGWTNAGTVTDTDT